MPCETLLKSFEQLLESPRFIGDTGVVILFKLLVGDELPRPLAKTGVDCKETKLESMLI